jgi:DNA invertase Pin-like site-specific DNA recombinase/G3E family GTPase
MISHPKIQPVHLTRQAYVYVRQSTLRQVLHNAESTERQYALAQRACELGWSPGQVVTIDEDQGHSGATARNRTGFQQLIAAMGLDQVGIVLALEVSRLARSCSDWYRVLELAALSGTLIGDEEGVYDPRDYNDRLLLGLKGTLSEAELYAIKARLQGGRLNKARKGELAQMLPVGLVRGRDGSVRLDPHTDVQTTLRVIFDQFDRLGSANAVLRYFRDQDLQMPRLITTGEDMGQIVWHRASYAAIHLVLTNPAYAGTFAFGRRKQAAEHIPGEATARNRLPIDEWQVLIQNVYPAYITWEHYLANRARLLQNQGQFANRSGVPRQGEALLQGIVFCARCGRRMLVRYGETPIYICDHLKKRYGEPLCQTFTTPHVDRAVVEAFLQIVEPARIEATLKVFDQLDAQREAADRLWQQRLERAEYEAERAQRQYSRVEPENRLVARELETQWNTALHALNELKQAYAQAQTQILAPLSTADRELVARLVEDLPRVWHAPTTTPADQKRMLRCLIQDVNLDSFSQAGQTRIHIHWHTGCVTTLTVPRPTAADAHRLDTAIVDLVRELAQTHSDDRIAEILNARGLQTRQGLSWSYQRVMRVRYRYHISTACPITPRDQEPRGDGLLSVKAAAERLDTHPNTIVLWARQGILYSEQKPGTCPIWVRVTPEDITRLTQSAVPPDTLRIRQACQVLQLTATQFWAEVKAGRYTVYRVQRNEHWEFRVTLQADKLDQSENRCDSQLNRGAL